MRRAAEFTKLAELTYRDVNIAIANEFAMCAGRAGIDVTEAIAAANSQPYSLIHQPGVGGGWPLRAGKSLVPDSTGWGQRRWLNWPGTSTTEWRNRRHA